MIKRYLVAGRYRILERAGEGGTAIVYRAEDTLLGRTVALKMPRDQYAGDSEFRRRFQREARAAVRLFHRAL